MPNEFARLRDAITSLTFRSRLRDATTPLRAFSLMTGIEMTCFLELFFNAYIYISRCLFKGFQKCTEVYRHRFWSTEVDFGRPRSTMKKRRFFRRFFTFLDIFSIGRHFSYMGDVRIAFTTKNDARKNNRKKNFNTEKCCEKMKIFLQCILQFPRRHLTQR